MGAPTSPEPRTIIFNFFIFFSFGFDCNGCGMEKEEGLQAAEAVQVGDQVVLPLAVLGESGPSVSPCHGRILQEAGIFVKRHNRPPAIDA
jgi:hypothetical protein